MLTMAKSPRMVPGADARGLVAPRRAVRGRSVLVRNIYDSISEFNSLRPVLTASRPSHTMAQMGPLSISIGEGG